MLKNNKDVLNNIQTENTWIDVETLAKLKNITKRAVRLSLNQNKYEYKIEKIRGGKTYKIKLSTIEEEYQLKYVNEYYAEWFRDNNYDKWILAREGQKALKDKVEPYIVRNASLLKSGQVLIADGHTLNFQVLNPFTGKPCRATLIGFLDWKSGGLVGYDIMLEECTQSIASALRNAILHLDHIPDFVYQDNGRAFKSKFFNGDKKFEELGFTGIYQKLGIKPVYATPYNARAKVIERFFLDFQEGFEKLMPSYIGTSIENKPAYMKRNEKLHKQIHEQKANFIPTMEQAIALIEEWLKYKHAQPCTNAKGLTIQEVIDEVDKQNIDESQLDDLMMAQEIKSIGRNGIRFLKADYFDEALYGIKGQTIIKRLSNIIQSFCYVRAFCCHVDTCKSCWR